MSRASLIKMAGRNLSRNKTRNIATGIAMACGFAAFVALGGYLNRVENLLRILSVYGNRTGHLAIYKPDAIDKFVIDPEKYSFNEGEQTIIGQVISTVGSVAFYGGGIQATGLIGNGCRTFPFVAQGYDPAIEQKARQIPEVKAVVDELNVYSKGRGGWNYPAELGGLTVAEGLARLLHKPKVYDEFDKSQPADASEIDCLAANADARVEADSNVQLMTRSWSGMISAIDGEIISHFKTGIAETNSTHLVAPLGQLQKLLDTTNVAAYAVFLDLIDPKLVWAKKFEIESKLEKAGIKASVYSWADERVSPFYASTMGFLHTLVGFVGFVLAMIISFSIFNSATMTVIERSQEIGMMRSLGYTKKKVRFIFITECALLTFISLIFGGLLSVLAVIFVNNAGIPFKPPGAAVALTTKLTPDVISVVVATGIICSVSVATTLFAVWSISKQNVASLLLKVQR